MCTSRAIKTCTNLFDDRYLFDENVKKKDYSIAHQREASEHGEIDTAKCEKLNKMEFKIEFNLFPQMQKVIFKNEK